MGNPRGHSRGPPLRMGQRLERRAPDTLAEGAADGLELVPDSRPYVSLRGSAAPGKQKAFDLR